MIYGSVCSGIEAATVAWQPLGWKAAWFSEIDPFCCDLLKHRYPGIQNHGDFTKITRGVREYETAGTIRSDAPGSQPGGSKIRHHCAVRRLTPRECERLQGFPDDYTLIPRGKNGKLAADGPRYKAIGNSWAVPCAHWIGERIQAVEDLIASRA